MLKTYNTSTFNVEWILLTSQTFPISNDKRSDCSFRVCFINPSSKMIRRCNGWSILDFPFWLWPSTAVHNLQHIWIPLLSNNIINKIINTDIKINDKVMNELKI